MVKLGKKISALSIDIVRDHHAGNYTCVAVNRATSVNYTAELVVNGIGEDVVSEEHAILDILSLLIYLFSQPMPRPKFPPKSPISTLGITP